MNISIINTIVFFVIAYFIGSILPGYLIGKYFYQKDIRDSGSGNIGTTNAFRILGILPGTITFTLDVLKGTFAALLPMLLGITNTSVLIVGIGAVLGHVFSIFLKFKGGKAVATSAGVLLAYNPVLFLIAILIFFGLLLLTSMVSLSSIITFTVISIMSLWFHDVLFTITAILLTIVVYYRHTKNIKRIINLTEKNVPFGLVYWAKKDKIK